MKGSKSNRLENYGTKPYGIEHRALLEWPTKQALLSSLLSNRVLCYHGIDMPLDFTDL